MKNITDLNGRKINVESLEQLLKLIEMAKKFTSAPDTGIQSLDLQCIKYWNDRLNKLEQLLPGINEVDSIPTIDLYSYCPEGYLPSSYSSEEQILKYGCEVFNH